MQDTVVLDTEPDTDGEDMRPEFPSLEVSERFESDRAELETPVYPGIPFN